MKAVLVPYTTITTRKRIIFFQKEKYQVRPGVVRTVDFTVLEKWDFGTPYWVILI